MLYRAHVATGLALGGAAAAGARWAGWAGNGEQMLVVFGLCTVFSLVPDLDTASIIQRWVYRALLGLLVYLIATGRVREAAFLGTAATLPLVHKHRGWMHSLWAALLVPLIVLFLWDLYWRVLDPGPASIRETLTSFADNVTARHGLHYLAMTLGYILHLTVDFAIPSGLRMGRVA
jgi:membrane-bound metal-dependent hydrolase YbcI (DUF457 family)